MPNLYHDTIFPRVEGVGFLSIDLLEEAFILNEEEQYWLFREYHELNNRMETPEARRIFNPDHTANTLMLCLKREVLSKINQLVGNWNVFIDLDEIDMSMRIIRGEMTLEQASQKRENNELYADQLRYLYVWAKPNTPESFNHDAHQCYRRIDESIRDLEDRTAQLKAETFKLRRALDRMRHGIPRENEVYRHQAHVQHNNNVEHVKRTLWHISGMVDGLRDHLRHNQNEIQGAMDRVLGRIVREMPSWAREIPWMMQHLP